MTKRNMQWKRRVTRRSQRRGIAAVYVALGLTTFIGAAAVGVDLSFRHYKRAEAQKAADAAALAGAAVMYQDKGEGKPTARKVAEFYAAQNGYDKKDKDITVESGVSEVNAAQYIVTVTKDEPLFFAGIFGQKFRGVSATAIAEVLTNAPVTIAGMGAYGFEGAGVNLSLFGPYAYYSNGDAYSPMYLNDGKSNPRFSGVPGNPKSGKGYDFIINVPVDYQIRNGTSQIMIELFDPDTYNNPTGTGSISDADGKQRFDEIRAGHPGRSGDPTVTQYTLYAEGVDGPIAQATYGNEPGSDLQWVTPEGFTIDLNDPRFHGGEMKLRLNITTIDGSSENGFNLRAGPPRVAPTTGGLPLPLPGDGTTAPAPPPPFNESNGTSITAVGKLPINFNVNGKVKVTLGDIPTDAAGGKLFINKFDTDVGSLDTITYTCTSLPGQSFRGQLSSNGTWMLDTINIPSGYKMGTWYAEYQAGSQDTSDWEMTYAGPPKGKPGSVHLVR